MDGLESNSPHGLLNEPNAVERAPCNEKELILRQAVKHCSTALRTIGETQICLSNPRGQEIVAAHHWLGEIRTTLQTQISQVREEHAKKNAKQE